MLEQIPSLYTYRPEAVEGWQLDAVKAGIDRVWDIRYGEASPVPKTIIDNHLAGDVKIPELGTTLQDFCRKASRLAFVLCGKLYNANGRLTAGYSTTIAFSGFPGSGVSMLGLDTDADKLMTTAAHETAHCFGIVKDTAANLDNSRTPHNCSEAECIMFPICYGQKSFCNDCTGYLMSK